MRPLACSKVSFLRGYLVVSILLALFPLAATSIAVNTSTTPPAPPSTSTPFSPNPLNSSPNPSISPNLSLSLNLNLTAADLDHKDPIVIDSFKHRDHNDLGFWHGPGESLDVVYGRSRFQKPRGRHVRLYPSDPDQNYHTQLSALHCTSLQPVHQWFLHVVFSGSAKFSISLNQNNQECRPDRNPYPATWDTVEAGRYARGHDIYVPLSHFNIDHSRVVSVSFSGFYTREEVTLHRIEIVKVLPAGILVPPKLPTGSMVLRCTRPNSFAFGIDDGQPWFAKQIMDILAEEKVLVTFFAVGTGLRDRETNLTEVYREMLRRGHQIGMHSNTHRKMEGLNSEREIDNEIMGNVEAFRHNLDIETRYFRPPYGTVGARLRQRLAANIPDPYTINWSVDVEDWLWANSKTPERQVCAFTRDVLRGGNLAVMHYLSRSTVAYFREFIHTVKSAGMNIMRIDQCLEDPRAPPVQL